MTDASPFPLDVTEAAMAVLASARSRGWRLATAESCTGGLVAGALTEIAGSSDVMEGGVVTYSNTLKSALLGVRAEVLAAHGAVSEAVARNMAEGAVRRLDVDLAVSITGVAGPGGGSAEKPVGVVWMAAATRGATVAREHRFGDLGRANVRLASVRAALQMLLAAAS